MLPRAAKIQHPPLAALNFGRLAFIPPAIPVPPKYDESLFENTKMSFGEHLEELRGALFKSVAALVIGFLISLIFANQFVDKIQTPLRKALKEYYLEQEKQRFIDELKASGGPIPENLDAIGEAWKERGLITTEHRIDKKQVVEFISQAYPQLPLPQDDVLFPPREVADAGEDSRFLNLRFYHRIDNDPRVRTIATGTQDPFLILIKAALVLGAVISGPFIFIFIWQFVAAGLYPHEKSYVRIFLPISIVLFITGAAIAYFAVIPFVLEYLLWFFQIMGIDPVLRITEWISFVMILPIGFGIAFQLPLVMMFLERIGIFTVESYLSKWRMAVLVIFVVSMFLTPADPWSLIFMAVPLTFLYFGGILFCKWMPRRTTPFGEMVD